MNLIEVRKIWGKAQHNAFTDLVRSAPAIMHRKCDGGRDAGCRVLREERSREGSPYPDSGLQKTSPTVEVAHDSLSCERT